jgi:hypothetical protein
MDFNKPRIAFYYYVIPETNFRNDGPPLFLYFNAKRLLDPDAVTINKGKIEFKESSQVVHLFPDRSTEKYGKFDLHVMVDHGEDGLPVPLNFKIPSPSAYWVSDAHLGYDYRLKRAKEFDFVFCCQKDFIEKFHADGIPREKLYFLPHAVEPLVYNPKVIIDKWDWTFIGHLNSGKRVDLLDRLCKEFPNFYLGWRNPVAPGYNVLDDVSHKFNQSRVIVNDNIKDDINMRTFEALATKKCLLTQEITPLHELFSNWKHLVMYKNVDDAVEKMGYLLNNNILRDQIAEEGYRRVIEKHTYRHRLLEMLDKTIGYKPDGVKEGQNAVTVG